MIHSPQLLDVLSGLPTESFAGESFRATPQSLNPLAPSSRGGRWAPPNEFPILYTCLDADGCRAEVAYNWCQLSPIPGNPGAFHRIRLTTKRSIRLDRPALIQMGVIPARYADNRYEATQRIGAAVRHMGFDALIVPSARWDCDNLVLFPDNHAFDNDLAVLSTETFDWMHWAITHGFLDASDSAVQAALKTMSEQTS